MANLIVLVCKQRRGARTVLVVLGFIVIAYWIRGTSTNVIGAASAAINANDRGKVLHQVTVRPYDPRYEHDDVTTNDKVTSGRAYDLVVNGYMRSGTTFLGRLMSFQGDAFYWFEPLWNFDSGVYYWGPDRVCQTYNPSCRNVRLWPSNETLHPHNMQTVLDRVFKCELTPLVPAIADGMTDIKSGESWTGYRHCRKMNQSQADCAVELQQVCKQAKHRVSKVVRMTVDNLEHLLETNLNIKVIHLFRDPRAIINSRLKEDWYQLSVNRSSHFSEIKRNAKYLCTRMLYDFRAGLNLKRKYPNRFTFVLYEDLIESVLPRARLLYSYIGADSTFLGPNVVNITLGSGRVELLSQKNYTSWWRTSLDYDIIKVIDVICSDVYDTIGYIRIADNATLFDSTAPSFAIRKELRIENISLNLLYNGTLIR